MDKEVRIIRKNAFGHIKQDIPIGEINDRGTKFNEG